MLPELGQLRKVDPRAVWPYEAADFTPWLAAHLPQLSAALGADLELTEREADVGDFSLDILAKDLSTGRNVIIENQLTATDHDHLGKLLTYAAGYEATTVVWIATSLRDEHQQALEWLNARTDENTSFFGVVVEVLQIDESKPAVTLRVAVAPHDWSKHSRKPRADSDRAERYRAFFQGLIDELREKHSFTSARLGQPQSWYAFASQRSGVKYSASFISGNRIRTELYVDFGDRDRNKALFDALYERRSQVESALKGALSWERLDAKQACRVSSMREGSILASEDQLLEYRSWLVSQLLAFRQAFGPLLADRSLGSAA